MNLCYAFNAAYGVHQAVAVIDACIYYQGDYPGSQNSVKFFSIFAAYFL